MSLDRLATDYVEGVLLPQLHAIGLNEHQRAIIARDVHSRLNSLLARWDDAPFRRTILSIGAEEGSFYEPHDASLDVRALVVVAVRNSLIEDIATQWPVTAALRENHRKIEDAELIAITKAAIEHFRKLDESPTEGLPQVEAREDPFGGLPARYTGAWNALSRLANASSNKVIYEPVDVPVPNLPAPSAPGGPVEDVDVYASGIDAGFDATLLDRLSQIKQGPLPCFFTDCFKGVTRNPEKLFRVIEFVLACQTAFITHNYLLFPTCALRREHFLRPFHGKNGQLEKFSQTAGLTEPHRKALAFVRASIG